jgi:Fe2+ transport system protein B
MVSCRIRSKTKKRIIIKEKKQNLTDMYTFPNKLRNIAFVLMILGLIGIVYGFLAAPKTVQDVEKIMSESHDEHHGASHDSHAATTHDAHKEATHDVTKNNEAKHNAHTTEAYHKEEANHENHDSLSAVVSENNLIVEDSAVSEESNLDVAAIKAAEEKQHVKHEVVDHKKEHDDHVKHVLHQLQNKPWAALYVACIFFLLISMGVLAFYAIQQVAQAGWSPVLFRTMQGITAYLPVGSVIFFILLLLSGFHVNHLFAWMEEGVTQVGHEKYDKLIAAKSGYLNFLIRLECL